MTRILILFDVDRHEVNDKIRDAVIRDMPARRLASGEEQTELVLSSPLTAATSLAAGFPFANGWAW